MNLTQEVDLGRHRHLAALAAAHHARGSGARARRAGAWRMQSTYRVRERVQTLERILDADSPSWREHK